MQPRDGFSNAVSVARTILTLVGLILFLVFGGKALQTANSWQAVHGKPHLLPSLAFAGGVVSSLAGSANEQAYMPVANTASAKPQSAPAPSATSTPATATPSAAVVAVPSPQSQPANTQPAKSSASGDSNSQSASQNANEHATTHSSVQTEQTQTHKSTREEQVASS
jgi:hypothetical protein